MVTFSTKREIRHLHVVIGIVGSEIYKKSVMHVQAKLLLRFSKPIAFLKFSFPSPFWLLKLPIYTVFVKEYGSEGHCADRSGERSAESNCTNSTSAMTAIF